AHVCGTSRPHAGAAPAFDGCHSPGLFSEFGRFACGEADGFGGRRTAQLAVGEGHGVRGMGLALCRDLAAPVIGMDAGEAVSVVANGRLRPCYVAADARSAFKTI